MISTDFAPNETLDDALTSLATLIRPWKWKKGNDIQRVKKSILTLLKAKGQNIHFFLTGRAALFHYLQQLNLPKNAEIIIPGFTCTAVVLPILANKLKPIYADIDTQTFSPTRDTIASKITNHTKAIIIQHTFGIPPHRDEILKLAQKHNLVVIEDLAHGFDRRIFHKDTWQTVKLLSFGRSKALSSFFGGAIITTDKTISKQLETREKKFPPPSYSFIFRGLLYKPFSLLIKTTYNIGIGKIIHFILNKTGFISREINRQEKAGEYSPKFDKTYPNACAALLNNQMKKLRKMQKQRGIITKYYHDFFSLVEDSWKIHIEKNTPLTRYPVKITNRTQIIEKMKKIGLYVGTWYTQPVAPKGVSLTKMKYPHGSCPVAEEVCENIINLPTLISKEQAKKIIEFMRKEKIV